LGGRVDFLAQRLQLPPIGATRQLPKRRPGQGRPEQPRHTLWARRRAANQQRPQPPVPPTLVQPVGHPKQAPPLRLGVLLPPLHLPPVPVRDPFLPHHVDLRAEAPAPLVLRGAVHVQPPTAERGGVLLGHARLGRRPRPAVFAAALGHGFLRGRHVQQRLEQG